MILVILLTKLSYFICFFSFFFNNILARKQCSKCCPRLCNQTTSTSEINDKEYDNRIGWTNSIKGQRTLFACRKVWHFLCTRQRIKFYIVVQVSQYLLKDVYYVECYLICCGNCFFFFLY